MNDYLKLFIICSIPFLTDCSASQVEKSNIPEEVRNLENITIYQRPENPDTLILHHKQTFGDTDSILNGRILDIAVDSLGRVFTADFQKQAIDAFKQSGNFIKQLGRSGKGPGEFATLREVYIRNNFLYAYDPSQYKVNVFSLDTLGREQTIFLAKNRGDYQELNRSFPWINDLYVRNNQTFLAGFKVHPKSREIEPWQNVKYKILFYLLDKDGNISSNKIFDVEEPNTSVGGLIDNIKVFFGSPRIALSSNNNIYVSEESDYFLIKIYSPTGAYLRAFYYPHPNIPLTKKSATEGGITGTHFRHEFLIKHMESIDLPQNWPVLTGMKIDDQDRLWISTTVKDIKVYQWWVLLPDGKLIARFNWPRSKPVLEIKNGYLYTKETKKKNDVEQVIKYKISIE